MFHSWHIIYEMQSDVFPFKKWMAPGWESGPKSQKEAAVMRSHPVLYKSELFLDTAPYRPAARMLEKGFLYCVDDKTFLHNL